MKSLFHSRIRKIWIYLLFLVLFSIFLNAIIDRAEADDNLPEPKDFVAENTPKPEELVNNPHAGESALDYMIRQQDILRVTIIRIEKTRAVLAKILNQDRPDHDLLVKTLNDTIRSNVRVQNQVHQRWYYTWEPYQTEKTLRQLNQDVYDDWSDHVKWDKVYSYAAGDAHSADWEAEIDQSTYNLLNQ